MSVNFEKYGIFLRVRLPDILYAKASLLPSHSAVYVSLFSVCYLTTLSLATNTASLTDNRTSTEPWWNVTDGGK